MTTTQAAKTSPKPTTANVGRVLEKAGFSRGGADGGRMGNTTQHCVTSGFKCAALFDLSTCRAAKLGVEVRTHGRGPTLDQIADALRPFFAVVVLRDCWVEVPADQGAV